VVRTAIGLNTWQGVEYVNRDAFESMILWAVRLDAIDVTTPPKRDLVARLSAAAEAAGYRVDRLRAMLAAPKARTPGAPRKPRPKTDTRKRPSGRPPGSA
jgi:hypothetical protein